MGWIFWFAVAGCILSDGFSCAAFIGWIVFGCWADFVGFIYLVDCLCGLCWVDYIGWVMVVGCFRVGNCEPVNVGSCLLNICLCLYCFSMFCLDVHSEFAGEGHKLTCTSTSLRGTNTGSCGNSQSSLLAPVLRALPAVTKVDG